MQKAFYISVVLASFGAFFGLGRIIFLVVLPFLQEGILSPLSVTLINDLILIGVFGFVMHALNLKLTKTYYRPRRKDIVVLAVLVVGTFWCAGLLGSVLATLTDDPATKNYSEMLSSMDETTLIILTLFVGPLLEEIFVRGVVFGSLARAFSPKSAAVVSAALFSWMHMTVMHIAFTFMLGLVLAYVYVRTASIGACFVVHMGFNMLSFASPYTVHLPEFFYSATVWLGGTILLLGAIWMLVARLPKKCTPSLFLKPDLFK